MERPRISERRMYSWCNFGELVGDCGGYRGEGDGMYLSNIRTNLAYFRKESQTGHPFIGAKTGFSCEVVKVCDESLENVF